MGQVLGCTLVQFLWGVRKKAPQNVNSNLIKVVPVLE